MELLAIGVVVSAFIGVSAPNIVSGAMVGSMAPRPIVFAMANPVPEIMPEEAKKGGAFIVGTGRSDFPNQINNALGFPGIFRGLLDRRKKEINMRMLIRAANALAEVIPGNMLKPERIIPSPFDKGVVKAVSGSMRE